MTFVMDRHVGTTVLLAIASVTVGILFLTFVFSLIDETQLGSAERSMSQAVVVAIWTLPPKLTEIMPFTIFLGALIGLGVLSMHSEITVYRSAGVSTTRLFVSSAIPSLLVVAVLMTTSLLFTIVSSAGRGSDQASLLETEWVKSKENFIEIGALNRAGVAERILDFEFDEKGRLETVTQAESGSYDSQSGKWKLNNVRSTGFDRSATRVEVSEHSDWVLTRSPDSLITSITKKPNKMNLIELFSHIGQLKAENLDATKYQIEFWRTLCLPVSILGLVLIATSFVMGQTRDMSMGTRLIIGVGVGFAFHYVQSFVTPLSIVYQFHPLVAIVVPIVLVWMLGVWLLVRAR